MSAIAAGPIPVQPPEFPDVWIPFPAVTGALFLNVLNLLAPASPEAESGADTQGGQAECAQAAAPAAGRTLARCPQGTPAFEARVAGIHPRSGPAFGYPFTAAEVPVAQQAPAAVKRAPQMPEPLVQEPPQTPKPPAVHELSIRIQDERSGHPVEIRAAERGGEVRIAVRAVSPATADGLRQNLPDLAAGLASAGFRGEIWAPSFEQTPSGERRPRRQRRDPLRSRDSGARPKGEPPWYPAFNL